MKTLQLLIIGLLMMSCYRIEQNVEIDNVSKKTFDLWTYLWHRGEIIYSNTLWHSDFEYIDSMKCFEYAKAKAFAEKYKVCRNERKIEAKNLKLLKKAERRSTSWKEIKKLKRKLSKRKCKSEAKSYKIVFTTEGSMIEIDVDSTTIHSTEYMLYNDGEGIYYEDTNITVSNLEALEKSWRKDSTLDGWIYVDPSLNTLNSTPTEDFERIKQYPERQEQSDIPAQYDSILSVIENDSSLLEKYGTPIYYRGGFYFLMCDSLGNAILEPIDKYLK